MAEQMGRPSVFRPKPPETNVHGRLTLEGRRMFELARKALAKIVGWKSERVSDGDVIEFLARGERNTRAYLGSGSIKKAST